MYCEPLAMISSRSPSGFLTLSDDVWFLIITSLEVKDILSLAMTCKRLQRVTDVRWIWSDALRRHVLQKRLPVPSSARFDDIASLTSQQLKERVVHAARLHHTWCSPSPSPRRILQFQADEATSDDLQCLTALDEVDNGQRPPPLGPVPQQPESHLNVYHPSSKRVTQVLFLPGRDGELIVTVFGKHIVCWEVPLDGTGAFVAATWAAPHNEPQNLRVVANEDPDSEAVLACMWDPFPDATGAVTALAFDRFHGKLEPVSVWSGFDRLHFIRLLFMRGDHVLVGGRGGCMWDWRNNIAYTLGAGAGPFDANLVLAVKQLGARHLVLVRQRGVQLLPLPFPTTPTATTSSNFTSDTTYAQPLFATSLLNYGGTPDEAAVVLSSATSASITGPDVEAAALTILPNCRRPNRILPMRILLIADTAPHPCHAPLCRREAAAGWRVAKAEVATPGLEMSPSAVLLNAGPSGKGFWVETRNVRAPGASRTTFPARCVVSFTVNGIGPLVDGAPAGTRCACHEGEHREEEGAADGDESGASSSTATARSGANAEDRRSPYAWGGPIGVRVANKELYTRRCAVEELAKRQFRLCSAAMDDTVGRIAIGNSDGQVEVLDFA